MEKVCVEEIVRGTHAIPMEEEPGTTTHDIPVAEEMGPTIAEDT
jgi:hypothetical protein